MIQRQLCNLFWLNSYSLSSLIQHLPQLFYYYYFTHGKAPWPLNLTIEPTNRCNLQCKGCFVNYNKNSELTLSQWKKFLTTVKVPSVYIAGGEPFLRPGIYEMLHLLRKQSVNFGLTTNGTLIQPSKLASTNINYVIFSLDGPKQVHDAVRGIGAYDKLMKNMGEFVKRRQSTKVFINTMINPSNYKSLSQVPAIAKAMHVDGISLQHFVYSGKKGFNLPSLHAEIMRWQSECKRLRLRHYFKPHLSSEQIRAWYTSGYKPKSCLQPWSLIRINPQGGVYFCYPYLEPVGNITVDPLNKILNSKRAVAFRRMIKEGCSRKCNRCCKG